MGLELRYEAFGGALTSVAEHEIRDAAGALRGEVRREGGLVGVDLVWMEAGTVRFRMEKAALRTGSWSIRDRDGRERGTIRHRPLSTVWELAPTAGTAGEARVKRLGRPRGPITRGDRTIGSIERTTPWTRMIFVRSRSWRIVVDDPSLVERGGDPLGDLVLALPVVLDHRERAQGSGDST